jgi:ATP-dependent 26S proteasome regulatory subunit
MKVLGLLTWVFLTTLSVHADELPDSFFASGFGTAAATWLEIDAEKGESTSSVYDTTIYRSGYSLALDQLFAQGKWQVHKVLNQGSGGVITAKGVDYIQVSQAPKVTQRLCVDCIAFVSKAGDRKKTLLVNIANSSVVVTHKVNASNDSAEESVVLAQEFLDDAKAQLKSGLVYKGGVLEFQGDVHFMPGVDGLKSTWDEFVFPDYAKNEIRQTIDGFINEYDEAVWSHLGLPLNRGVLLYGPPGTGKSFIAKILSANILRKRYKNKVTYIHISARHINSVDQVRNIYQVARELTPVVVFFEDIDLIAGTDRSDRPDLKNELMQQLSGLETLKGVLTIGTTNVADRIDSALKRSKRLGFQFEIGLPKPGERVQLFQIYFAKAIVDSAEAKKWAELTEGYAGADIKELCEVAIEKALSAGSFKEGSNQVVVLSEHIEQAFREKSKNRVRGDLSGGGK